MPSIPAPCGKGTALLLRASVALLFACEFPERSERYACKTTADCDQGRTCDDGFCVLSSVEATVDSIRWIDAPTSDADDLATACTAAGYTYEAGLDGYYRVVAAGASWTDAKNACAADVPGKTHLIVLSTSAEVSFATNPSFASWIGLSDLAAEGQFVTVTGEIGDQRPWNTGEPNNGAGLAGGEDCVILNPAAKLDDKACGLAFRYTCECDGRMSMP